MSQKDEKPKPGSVRDETARQAGRSGTPGKATHPSGVIQDDTGKATTAEVTRKREGGE